MILHNKAALFASGQFLLKDPIPLPGIFFKQNKMFDKRGAKKRQNF